MNVRAPIFAGWSRKLAALLLAAVLPAFATQPALAAQLAAPSNLLLEAKLDPLAVAEAHPALSWRLVPAAPGLFGVVESGYQIQVAAAKADLAAGRKLFWDSGKLAATAAAPPSAAYAGPALEAGHSYWWRVRVWDGADAASPWSEAAHFAAAPLWQAQWIASAATDAEAAKLPMPLFRKRFLVDGAIRSAVLHISGLGQYEAHLNGAKIGDAELAPGWSDYRKTVFYDSYDVTRLLHQGQNALGVMLGNGMFRVEHTAGRYTKLEGSFGSPQLRAQLRIELANGKTLEILSDPSWKTTAGPVVFSSPYGGEDYDAQHEIAGWDTVAFNDTAWSAAQPVAGPGGELRPEAAAAIRAEHRYQPVSRTEIKVGVAVYDLGQNFAGWPAITVRGPAGSAVKLIAGELLNADGTVSQKSTGKPQWFTYTLKGAGTERWQPRFSYWGFRYVQVETAGGARVTALEGQAVHSSSTVVGSFASSDEHLNRIHALILRSMENNAESVLTDCPHREKLGWLEETHLLAPSLLFDFDFRGIYRALDRNLTDAQKPDGSLPEIAPQFVVFGNKWGPFDDSPEWGSAAVLAPWYLYQRTGEVAPLLAARQVMRRYVDYLGTRAEGGIVRYGLGDWYDIGPGAPGMSKLTTAGVTATAIYYQDLLVLERTLALGGDGAASKHYAQLAESVRAAFNAQFYNRAHHRYDKGSQTAQAMPLALDMEPEGERAAVLQALIDDIHAHNDHVTAGDIGYHYVVDALLANGRSEVLLAMLERTDAPSYGYQLTQGATALTEAWDANPASSQDHFMLGDAEEWFYRGLGGIYIDQAAAPEKRLRLEPRVLGDLRWVKADYQSTWGMIESHWRRSADTVTYTLTVPISTTATVRIASAQPQQITVNQNAPATASGVLKARFETDAMELVVGSGSYRMVAPAPTSNNRTPQADAEQEAR